MPKVTIPAHGWRPRKHQLPLWGFLEHGGKRAIEIAHRRWGKDDVALHRAACAAMERVGGIWHMLPEYSQARKAIWTAVNPQTGRRRIDEAFPPIIRANTNDQEMFIRFKNGSTWQVIGSDNYDRLVGASVAGVVFSEWALANPSSWAYLAPIVAENKGWALFITTPRGRNHAFAMYQMAQKNPRDWFCETSNVTATQAISEELLEQQRREYHMLYGEDAGNALIDQEYFCSFEAAILGAYYGKEMARAEQAGRIASVPAWPNTLVHTAWDLGASRQSDSMAIWLWQAVPGSGGQAQIRILAYLTGSGMSIRWYAEEIERITDELRTEMRLEYPHEDLPRGVDYVPHDARVPEMTSSGTDGKAKLRFEVMIECGLVPKIVTNHLVADGVSAVRQLFPRFWFDAERCGPGIESIRQYQTEWDDDLKKFKDTPLRNWAAHGADAFRYLAMAFRELRVEDVPPKGRMLTVGPDGAAALPPGVRPVTLEDMWRAQRSGQSRRI